MAEALRTLLVPGVIQKSKAYPTGGQKPMDKSAVPHDQNSQALL
jgi:hypothetical protein